ncbi:signal peptidase II [Gammaproteobacteria bacterium]|nr:signal peptidase II [Gammaproteobacteria bacterium]
MFLFPTLLLIFLDQLTKYIAYLAILPTLPGLNWHVVYNTGVSFGLGANTPFIVIAISQLLIWRYIIAHCPNSLGQTLITAGFIANLLDRLTYGGVLDFITITPLRATFPFTFNLADIYISLGAIILICHYITVPNSTA